MIWNDRMSNQVDSTSNSAEHLHTEKLITNVKNGDLHACEELFRLFKCGNEQAHDALTLEVRRENGILIKLLLQKIKEEDDDSVDILLDSNRDYIFRYCRKFFNTREQAEDMTQETFINAVKAIKVGNYQFQESFQKWLFRIARNACFSERNKINTKKRGGGNPDVPIDSLAEQPSDEPSPEQILFFGERKARLKFLVDQLPKDMRDTITLIDYYDYTYGETARILHVSEGTIKSRRNRGIKKLVKMIKVMSYEEREALFVENRNFKRKEV